MNHTHDPNHHPNPPTISAALRETTPQARRGFREQLEAQLLAEFQSRPEPEEEYDAMIPIKTTQYAPTIRLSIPLTMVAALAAVWLIVTVMLIGGRPQPNLSQITAATLTPVPSPTPYSIPVGEVGNLRPVVIAAYDLPRGMLFDETGSAKLHTVYWPESVAPEGTFAEEKALTNLYLQHAVQQWQPIFAADVGDSDPIGRIPDGTMALAIPLDRITTVQQGIIVGQTIDVYAAMLFVDASDVFQSVTLTPDATPRLNIQRIAANAEVVAISTVEEALQVVTLAVSSNDAATLQWALDAQLPLMFAYPAPSAAQD